MDRSRYNKNKLYAVLFVLLLFVTGCDAISSSLKKLKRNIMKNFFTDAYTGSIELCKHSWLKDRKIFLDPGHGGDAQTDRFRIGPGGVREAEVNLKVALILKNMLKQAGAVIELSRDDDSVVDLDTRVSLVQKFGPELLISLHHNGTPRRKDTMNYPAVLIWGNKQVRPASYDFARYLLEEYHKIIDTRGRIVSDHAIFPETGTRILRKTRYICPGVIGEAGFFDDTNHALRLKDEHYLVREAEAYFYAISRYFKRGIPTAEVLISCPYKKVNYIEHMIQNRSPLLWIRVNSDNSQTIDEKSLRITINDLPVRFKRYSRNLYRVLYGRYLYAGGHKLRFYFRNKWGQSSMVYYTSFMIEMKRGEYDRLANRGRYLLNWRNTARRGLEMLLAIRPMGITGPKDDRILWDISRGFRIIGNYAKARYYLQKLYFFYPQSYYSRYISKRYRADFRYPVEYHGKRIELQQFYLEDCKKIAGCRRDEK